MDKQKLIKEIMIEAIETPQPKEIIGKCRAIWNQPFFYKIDSARAITFSYSPTDKGARTNYIDVYHRYQVDRDSMSSQQIFDLLYNFKKEKYWRKNYDKILSALNIDESNIAHMDMSCFAYDKDKYRQFYVENGFDTTYRFALSVLDILAEDIEYILIDGKDNSKMIEEYFIKDYNLVAQTKIVVNSSNRLSDLKVYHNKSKNIKLIYFGTFLYGATCVSENCINEIISFIKTINP